MKPSIEELEPRCVLSTPPSLPIDPYAIQFGTQWYKMAGFSNGNEILVPIDSPVVKPPSPVVLATLNVPDSGLGASLIVSTSPVRLFVPDPLLDNSLMTMPSNAPGVWIESVAQVDQNNIVSANYHTVRGTADVIPGPDAQWSDWASLTLPDWTKNPSNISYETLYQGF